LHLIAFYMVIVN